MQMSHDAHHRVCMFCLTDLSCCVVAVNLDIISLLASMGADPSCLLRTSTLSYAPFAPPHVALHTHLLTIFHPAAVGMTCIIPIDMCISDQHGQTIFQQLAGTEKGHTLRRNIQDINRQMTQRQHHTMQTFAMGTHTRVGQESAVSRVFRSSRLYDAQLMRVIWSYVYVRASLPSTHTEAIMMQMAGRYEPPHPYTVPIFTRRIS